MRKSVVTNMARAATPLLILGSLQSLAYISPGAGTVVTGGLFGLLAMLALTRSRLPPERQPKKQ